MKRYLATLWIALRGEPGYCLVREIELQNLRARIARYERRAEAQRKSRADRQVHIVKPALVTQKAAT